MSNGQKSRTSRRRINFDSIRSAANSRWHQILSSSRIGIGSEYLSGIEGPCPKPSCGGKTRFRFTNLDGDGSALCSHCGNDLGNGFYVVQWFLGGTIDDAFRTVAEIIGAEHQPHAAAAPANGHAVGRRTKSSSRDLKSKFRLIDPKFPDYQKCLSKFAAAKQPITVESLNESGAFLCGWPIGEHGKTCIGWGAIDNLEQEPVGYILRHADGSDFEPYEKLVQRKTHMIGGSADGWILIGGIERFRQAEFVWRCEGILDAVAVHPHLPANHIAISNICGAGSCPKNLDLFAGKVVYSWGDADKPGQDGAIKFATKVQSTAIAVKCPQMPWYDVAENHGKDLRDALSESHAFSELLEIAESSPALPGLGPLEGIGLEGYESDPLSGLQSVISKGVECLFRDDNLLRLLAVQSIDDRPAYAANRQIMRKAGVRMRDLERVLRPLVIEIYKSRPVALARDQLGGFFEKDGSICRMKLTPDGQIAVQVCNFTACIKTETVRDDGLETSTSLTIEGKLANGKPLSEIEILATQFTDPMNWVVPLWGSDAIVWPGETRSLGPAIQALSQDSDVKKKRRVFAHTGWRKFNEGWGYLHAGGCITPHELTEKPTVDLQSPLDRYILPDPPTGDELTKAIVASMEISKVCLPEIAIPLLAAGFRSILGPCDFSVFLAGLTGTGKTETVALIQQHFGSGMDSRHLPGSWSSTANANESLAFIAKDALIVVDDFIPAGSAADVSRFHRDADRLLRAQGNSAGRGRMNANGSLRQTKFPRGLICSTGEDIPIGHSLRARMLIIEFDGDSVDWEAMTKAQAHAASGLYSKCMSGFIRWVATDYDANQIRRKRHVDKFRAEHSSIGGHARVGSLIGELVFGWRAFLAFANQANAISTEKENELFETGKDALIALGQKQAEYHRTTDPVEHFLNLLASAISSGSAHVTKPDGSPPDKSSVWGWQESVVGTGVYSRVDWKPRGSRIGWLCDDTDLFLNPDATFSVVQRLAESHGRPISMSQETLWRRAKDHTPSILADWDRRRQRVTVRKSFQGKQYTVLHMKAATVFPTGDDQPDNRNSKMDGYSTSIGQSPTPDGQDLCTEAPDF